MNHVIHVRRLIEVKLEVPVELDPGEPPVTPAEAREEALELLDDKAFISFEELEDSGVQVADSGWEVISQSTES